VNCDEIRRLLSAFGDASLPEPGRVDVSRHLASCVACRGQAERRARLASLLRIGLPVPEPGEIHFERERARILKPARVPGGHRRAQLLMAGALAAAAVIMVVAGPKLLRTPRRTETSAPAPVVRTETIPQTSEPASVPPVVPKKDPPSPVPSRQPEGPAVAKAGPPAGTAERLGRMTREAVEVALAETPSERVATLCAAAEAQLRELQEAVAKDPTLAAELAGAYRILVGQGVAGVLQDQGESEVELAAARDLAARRAREHEAALAALAGGASGPLKESLGEALAASRSLSGR
jgi:hypothetical protein